MFAGDEWKLMGLAAYGKPDYYDFFARKVLTVNGNHDFHLNIRVLDHHLAKPFETVPHLEKIRRRRSA